VRPDETFPGREVPLPPANLVLYERIYRLEQWLRRISLAALMLRYGTRWRDGIPTDISKVLKARRDSLRGRVHLNVENVDNVVWLLTLEELRRMLTSDFLHSSVRALTKFHRLELASRLEQLREIRNVVGHNRAATPETVRILENLETYLFRGIDRFRRELLYDANRDLFTSTDESDVASRELGAREHLASWHQIILGVGRGFYDLVSLPRPSEDYVDLGHLLEAFNDIAHTILALFVNDAHNEFSVVWPRDASELEHAAIIERMLTFDEFTNEPYEQQDWKFVCDPRIWFYTDTVAREFRQEAREGG
jgi:hypothetical protein